MQSIYFMYGISILAILLGFIALLSQKIYLDQDTMEATEVEVPFFGKIKSNYPALIFVFIGAAIAMYTFETSYQETEKWTVSGTFQIPGNKKINWSDGELKIFPADIEINVVNGGRFEISLNIEKGKEFEDVIERINYSHPEGSITLFPQTELDNMSSEGKVSLIKSKSKHSREYSVLKLNTY